MNKNLSEITSKELSELYSCGNSEIEQMMQIINVKTGYYVGAAYSLMPDENKKCLEIDMKISMLERPHEVDELKVRHYIKNNPDNVLNKPILAYEHNSWYMIFDGVHRTEANRRLGKTKIKATIIIPNNKD